MAKVSSEVRANSTDSSSFEYNQTFSYNNVSQLYLIIKRTVDISGATFGLIIAIPLFVLISIMYLFGESKGPVFFKQIRIGQNGKRFYIYKFRSMLIDADQRLKQDSILYKKYLESNYKLEPEEDPRITSLGRFLRKTSLDEIPQLINVIKGEMSLVGPRPVVEDELLEYGHKQTIFLSTKPGVTGYWQVCGRSDVGYPERVNLELYYVYNRSNSFDIKIMFKTIWVVLTKNGAY